MNKNEEFTPLRIHPDAASALEPMRPLFKWPNVRWQKCLALYTLARDVEFGPIVELGTYHGCGTLALALGNRDGARVPLYTIDPFVDYDGWIGGEHYGPADYDVFARNVETLGMQDEIGLIPKKSEDALRKWHTPYELLFWDICGDRLYHDYEGWYPHCAKGGQIVIKDLSSWQFGTARVFDHAIQNGFEPHTYHLPGLMWSLRRTE